MADAPGGILERPEDLIEFVGGPLDGDEFYRKHLQGQLPVWAIRVPFPDAELFAYQAALAEASSPDQTDPASPARLEAILELTPPFQPGGAAHQPPNVVGCYLVRGMLIGVGHFAGEVLAWHALT
jgi:hypothetical protein